MQGLLDFDRSPPFAGPLQFFMVAPVFGVLAGLLVALDGDSMFASRWMPSLLALTHLLTAGFMLHVMLGALMQVLPVIAGVSLSSPLWVSRLLQPVLSAGALCLCAGFLVLKPVWLQSGAGLLLLGGGIFAVLLIWSLRVVRTTSPTILSLKLALPGLLGTLGLGFWLLLTMLGGGRFSVDSLTDLHALWGLAAWGGILLAGIACVVVPMFQLTPSYPARPSWAWPVGVMLACLFGVVAVLLASPLGERIVRGSIAVLGLLFIIYTLHLQRKRRRARLDVTFRYWQFGLACSVPALLMVLGGAVQPSLTEIPAWSILVGTLLIGGGFVSMIIGMLYKIIPFLAWMHLQQAGQGSVMAPNMNQLLADRNGQCQFTSHVIALFLFCSVVLWPAKELAWLAGCMIALSQGWLLINLGLVVSRYRRHLAEIRRASMAVEVMP